MITTVGKRGWEVGGMNLSHRESALAPLQEEQGTGGLKSFLKAQRDSGTSLDGPTEDIWIMRPEANSAEATGPPGAESSPGNQWWLAAPIPPNLLPAKPACRSSQKQLRE